MNILKKIVVVLVVLVALLFVVSLFLPGQWHVERSMVVNAPAENVFVQVNNLKNWEAWSPWQKMDPGMKITYSGPEAGIGASYSWSGTSDKTGSGSLTIAESVPGELVVTNLDFGKEGTGTGGFRLEPAGDGTRITWYMDSRLDGMIAKYMGLMMTGMMEKTFDQGLEGIRELAEKMPPPSAKANISIEETTVPPLHYLAVRDFADESSIGAILGKSYGLIQAAAKKQGLKQVGAPFAIYYTDSKTNWELDACLGVDGKAKEDGRAKPGFREESHAVVAHYFGDYRELGTVHEALQQYLAEHSKQVTGPPWEEYITDPEAEKDTAKWQTDVYYPVQ